MKKTLIIILCVILSLSSFALTGCSDRSTVLRVYNVGEYMDEDVIVGFSDWYFEQTGQYVELEYKTYSTNEDMYTEIYKKNADYDVVVGSDYIVTRMIKNDLLLPIDTELVYGGLDESDVISSRIINFVNDYEGNSGVRYSVPYMWGTLGVMYRNDLADLEWNNLSWDCLFEESETSGSRYMKNSIRDAYAAGSVVANLDKLSAASNGFSDYNEEYRNLLKNTINDVSEKNMSAVEDTLKAQKDHLFAYESDDGKDDMITTSPSAYVGLFWSCDAGYAMEDSTDLYYGVPKEGSNVWCDAFVIPKYSKNRTAAQYFLKYLVGGEIEAGEVPVLNRDYAGCSSPIEWVQEETKEIMQTAWDIVCGKIEPIEDEDIEYYVEFFSQAEGDDFGDMYIDLLFPSDDVLARCAVMVDSPKDACIEMAKMWIRVKAF